MPVVFCFIKLSVSESYKFSRMMNRTFNSIESVPAATLQFYLHEVLVQWYFKVLYRVLGTHSRTYTRARAQMIPHKL